MIVFPPFSAVKNTRQETRQDIYYHNFYKYNFLGTQLAKTLVKACQINSITNQILHIIKKQRKEKEEISVTNSKARKKICLMTPAKV